MKHLYYLIIGSGVYACLNWVPASKSRKAKIKMLVRAGSLCWGLTGKIFTSKLIWLLAAFSYSQFAGLRALVYCWLLETYYQ